MRERVQESVGAVGMPSSAAIVELGGFAMHSLGQLEPLTQETAVRMGRMVTVSTFRIGDGPHDILMSTTPPRYSDDMKICAYADRALALVAERRAGRLALDAELIRTHRASTESLEYFARRRAGLREAFHRELLACTPRQNREVVARYLRNCDDLEATMRLVQARADQYGETLLNNYTELSDKDIDEHAADAYYWPDERDHYRTSAVAKNTRRRTWPHRLRVRIENYSDVVLGAMDAWWWRLGDLAHSLMRAGGA